MKTTASLGSLTRLLSVLFSSFLLLWFSSSADAQNNSGKEFWYAQTPNSFSFTYDTARIGIIVSNPGASAATISIVPNDPAKPTVTATLPAGSIQEFLFPSDNLNLRNSGKILSNVYHIISDRNVVVYGFNPWFSTQTNDASLLLPVHALGKKYMPGSYINTTGNTNFSFYGIIGTENGTTVNVFNRANQLVQTVVLQKGEYWQNLVGKGVASDVTGWFIEADKNISVFAGNQSTSIGNSVLVADHIEEQLLPVETLGRSYIASPTNSRPIGCTTCSPDLFRYVATEDFTEIISSVTLQAKLVSAPSGTFVPTVNVNLDPFVPVLLNKGQFLEIATSQPHVVTGTKPFYAYQYLISEQASGAAGSPAVPSLVPGIGDPDMMNVPVLEQFQFNYNFVVPNTFAYDVISIVAPEGAKMTLNGSAINLNWRFAGVINGTTYQATRYFVSDGAHKISSDKKFGLIVSGFGPAASYSYIGGSALEPINAGCVTGGPYQVLMCANTPVSVQLNGSAICDDGSAATMQWSSSDGVSFSNPNVPSPIATAPGTGTFSIRLTVTCGGNTVICETELIVREPLQGCANIVPPTLQAPPKIYVPADSAQQYASNVNLGNPTYSATGPVILINDGVGNLPVGINTVTWTLTDGNGITTTDDQEVVVVAAPTIIAPASVTVNNNPGFPYATGVLTDTATYTSDYGPNVLTNDAPQQFPVGSTIVTWTIKDGFGRTASATQLVTVVSEPPSIIPPPAITINADPGQNYASGVNLGNAIYTASVDPAVVNNNAPAQIPVGNTTVTWTVTDGLGRTASGTQIITILPECFFNSSVTSVPTSNVNTGGNPNKLYIGYGAQSTKLQVNCPTAVGGYTFAWSGPGVNKLSNATSAAPIFTPTEEGNYTFVVKSKNNTSGCTSTSAVTICVTDIRVLDKNGNWDGKKVYVCHLPPGNPSNVQILHVGVAAVPAHVPLHGGDGLGRSCSQTCNPVASKNVAVENPFTVSITPNPSSGAFVLQVKSDDIYTSVSVRIMDAFGRTVQVMNNVSVDRSIRFGEKFASGAYYAEVIQGADRKLVQLVKLK